MQLTGNTALENGWWWNFAKQGTEIEIKLLQPRHRSELMNADWFKHMAYGLFVGFFILFFVVAEKGNYSNGCFYHPHSFQHRLSWRQRNFYSNGGSYFSDVCSTGGGHYKIKPNNYYSVFERLNLWRNANMLTIYKITMRHVNYYSCIVHQPLHRHIEHSPPLLPSMQLICTEAQCDQSYLAEPI